MARELRAFFSATRDGSRAVDAGAKRSEGAMKERRIARRCKNCGRVDAEWRASLRGVREGDERDIHAHH